MPRVSDTYQKFRPRPSRYGNRCCKCGRWFEAECGWLIGRDEEAERWVVECSECFGVEAPGTKRVREGRERQREAWKERQAKEWASRLLPGFARTLGLTAWPTSTTDIKSAYRRLALTHHPDKGGDAAEFVRATEAYEAALAEARRCGL